MKSTTRRFSFEFSSNGAAIAFAEAKFKDGATDIKVKNETVYWTEHTTD